MNRNLASALAVGATAVVAVAIAALGSSNAYADDITVDSTPFTSIKTRADVAQEILRAPEVVRAGATE